MSGPDYPVLGLPSYETYQLAHIATYIAERLSRYRRSPPGRDGRAERTTAVRDLAGAAAALDGFVDVPSSGALPAPLDVATYRSAKQLITGGARTADIVSLAATGQAGWAVVGHVPGLGAVGARTEAREIADALRTHFMTESVRGLSPWAVTAQPTRIPTLPERVDLAAFVEHLDPSRAADRAVAAELRGTDRRTDAAIQGRFAHVDLDEAMTPPELPTGARNRRAARLEADSGHQRAHDQRRPVRNQGGPTPGG
ncbi:hypothetical protein GCM10017691_38050 [Pseudonocardia petroleophila]|uniref:Uncharacterized protein n=1 Tax=Pseudonocardia petroleophila TaxID=37331 RepID=A0A7G7MCE0_9PSEU|nr:hypothetical protein [Pseudonocardia petroleophila]QNG50451.1 hypothetical protein H6H00_19700 [Pseudonocardia petroleophila]